MSKLKKNALAFLLWSTLAGTISFFISSVLIAVVMLHVDLVIFDTIFAGGIGGLLLGIFLLKQLQIRKMVLAGFISVPIGFWSAFILAGGVDLLFSLIGVNSENPNISGIGNIIGIIFMGLICGAIFGAIIYGRRSIWLFSTVCGVISFPFGILVGLFNSDHPIKAMIENLLAVFGPIDLNFLAIITSFGIGIGLSIGLYERIKQNGIVKRSAS
ncbi:MAG: hypothetical protein GXY32_08775 [Ruminococcaceae bacterium]|nr:hypothetical protein [Oscillospiraceae bacterium]